MTKIVVHVPMFEWQCSFPWAKCSELISKKVFFMTSKKIPQINFNYEGNFYNIPVIDFSKKESIMNSIETFLIDETSRNSVIECNFNTIKYNHNLDLMLLSTLKKNTINNRINNKINDKINTFVFFKTQTSGFHNTHKEYIISYLNDKKYFISRIDIGFLSNDSLILNYMKEVIENKENVSNKLYVFNAEDYYQLYCMLKPDNIDIIYSFLEKINYTYFCYEVLYNNKLLQIGLNDQYFTPYVYKYYYSFDERFEFVLHFFKNSELILSSNGDNIKYLNQNNIKNVIYFPPNGYSSHIVMKNLNLHINKSIDVLFYGNLSNQLTYRINILQTVSDYCNTNKFIYKQYDNIIGEDKEKKLSETKIVIHVPSHENLETFPWAKSAELFGNNIFVIIEENKDIFTNNLQNIIVYYKHGDINDLTNKIQYYLNNPKERLFRAKLCYEYFKNNFNMNKLF